MFGIDVRINVRMDMAFGRINEFERDLGVTSVWLQQRGIRRAIVAVGSSIAVTVAGFAAVPQADADPGPMTIVQAKAQVDKLQQQADALGQDYLTLKQQLGQSEQALKDKQSDLATQTKNVAQMREQISRIALAQFQNQGLSPGAQLFLTRDPAGFLNQFATMEKINQNQTADLQSYQVQQANLADLQRSTKADIATLSQEKVQLAGLKKKANDKVNAAQAVLDKLTAKQRAAIEASQRQQAEQAQRQADKADAANAADESNSGGSNSDLADSVAPSSGKGAEAVAFAKAQIGKPYVFGATGPDSYDCSGLTQAAWAAAGVQLDRTSEEQFNDGVPVSTSDLEPGDLVFFYGDPPDHVAIYVGNGVVIHAPHPGESVQYAQLSSMPYVGARRPA